MNHIADRRSDIYAFFQKNGECQKFFYSPENKEKYVAYYNSMYLLQDSTEGLWQHREKGFSKDPLLAYIEFWGVMQAVIIQQDAIQEIFQILTEKNLTRSRYLFGMNSVIFVISAPGIR